MRSHYERRCSILGPTQSRISLSILEYTKVTMRPDQRAAFTEVVGFRLSGKGNSDSHGARPVHQIISTIKWIRTSRLSIKNSLQRT